MGVRRNVFSDWGVILVLLFSVSAGAVSTREIDKVRDKGVLNDGDLRIIDDFVAASIRELLSTQDFTSVAKTRTVILVHSESLMESAAAQYSEQFCESAYRYISDGFNVAEGLTPEELRVRVIVNLFIIIDGLGDTRLADLAIDKLGSEKEAVRYWAVHCLTNNKFVGRLNSGREADSRLSIRISEELSKIVPNCSASTMELMVKFTNNAEIARAEDLLLEIADERINRYANWRVDYELLEADILKSLYKRMEGVSDPVIARRFGQLYSYVMQRYIKGQEFLDDEQKNHLASVLVEVEKNCISRILDVQQSIIQKAIEQDDMAGLLLEHKRLFGNGTEAGQLALKLNFDYGKGVKGEEYISPLGLPEPPKI